MKSDHINSSGTVNVRDFGAVGDGKADDAPAIQRAIDSTQRGDCLVIPTGEYALSKKIVVSTPDLVFQGRGTLIPHGNMRDYLIEFGKGSRESVDFLRDSVGLRLVVESLRLNGMGQSRGIFFRGLYHCSFSNVSIMRTNGTAARFHEVRESDFYQMNINHSTALGEPLMDLCYRFGGEKDPFGGGWQWLTGRVDGQNNIRFFGLNLVHSTSEVYIDIGGDHPKPEMPHICAWPARAIHFNCCQIHLTQGDWLRNSMDDPDGSELRSVEWDVHGLTLPEHQTLVRIRSANSISFSQCNFPTSGRFAEDTCIQLGDERCEAVDVTFYACRMPHRPVFQALNCKRISTYGCSLAMEPWRWQDSEKTFEELVHGPHAKAVSIH